MTTEGFYPAEKKTVEIEDRPMSRSQLTRCSLWRSELLTLIDDTRACKRRRWSMPFQFTVAIALGSALIYSLIGLYVYDHTDPRPDHGIWTMYLVGACVEAALAILFLVWWWTKKKSSDMDLDELIRKMEKIDRDSPMESVSA
jgi:heme/copper-type cytochrome/quinol oxidase subunit 4